MVKTLQFIHPCVNRIKQQNLAYSPYHLLWALYTKHLSRVVTKNPQRSVYFIHPIAQTTHKVMNMINCTRFVRPQHGWLSYQPA